jgi:hypothetical protein
MLLARQQPPQAGICEAKECNDYAILPDLHSGSPSGRPAGTPELKTICPPPFTKIA